MFIKKIYKSPLNIKKVLVRAIISLPFVLLEIPIFILSLYLSVPFSYFLEKVFNLPMDYGLMKSEGFLALFVSCIVLFLVHVILYVTFKSVFKIAINLELSIISLVTAILFPESDHFDGGSVISMSELYIAIGVGYIFVLFQLLIFSGLIYWADKKYEEKHFRKIILSSLAAIVLGVIPSRLLWSLLLSPS